METAPILWTCERCGHRAPEGSAIAHGPECNGQPITVHDAYATPSPATVDVGEATACADFCERNIGDLEHDHVDALCGHVRSLASALETSEKKVAGLEIALANKQDAVTDSLQLASEAMNGRDDAEALARVACKALEAIIAQPWTTHEAIATKALAQLRPVTTEGK